MSIRTFLRILILIPSMKFRLNLRTGNVTLKYNGSRWKVNDEFNADPIMIDVLFATLQQAEPRRPLAASLKDSVAEESSAGRS